MERGNQRKSLPLRVLVFEVPALFSNGSGYIETDRGHSFPRKYLWTQCLWDGPKCGSLMLAIATIPLPVGGFTGCICSIFYGVREYRLATYRGVKIEYPKIKEKCKTRIFCW